MKTNNDSSFAEPVDARQEARFLALEVVNGLLIWMAEGHYERQLHTKAGKVTCARAVLRVTPIAFASVKFQALRQCHSPMIFIAR